MEKKHWQQMSRQKLITQFLTHPNPLWEHMNDITRYAAQQMDVELTQVALQSMQHSKEAKEINKNHNPFFQIYDVVMRFDHPPTSQAQAYVEAFARQFGINNSPKILMDPAFWLIRYRVLSKNKEAEWMIPVALEALTERAQNAEIDPSISPEQHARRQVLHGLTEDAVISRTYIEDVVERYDWWEDLDCVQQERGLEHYHLFPRLDAWKSKQSLMEEVSDLPKHPLPKKM